jgi:hypothetical protein
MKLSHTLALATLAVGFGFGSAAVRADTIVIAPDQATVIHKFVLEHKPAVVTVPSGLSIQVGAVLPADIALLPLDVPGVTLTASYEYVVLGDQTVIVDPGTRKIIQIL